MGDALYVSDNRTDQLVRVEPADFSVRDRSNLPQYDFGPGGSSLGLVGTSEPPIPHESASSDARLPIEILS
jgi:hypothetical protein